MSNYEIFVYGWIAIGFLSFPFILRYDAPYGRHTSNNWGPLVDNKSNDENGYAHNKFWR